jgi:RNA polymerase sigma-70 factor (ECF subfamily)
MNREQSDWITNLSERYGRMVFNTAYRVLGNTDDSEDVLQEVFLKLMKSQGRQTRPESIRDWGAYLRVTASRCAIDILRKKSRRREENWDYIDEIESPSENPRFAASENQKAVLLRHAISQLPEREAKLFALRYFEELTYDQIAEQMQINVNQVGVILHRSRDRIKELLQPKNEHHNSVRPELHVEENHHA